MKAVSEMIYQTRHLLRNSKLPECRHGLFVKIVDILSEQNGILGIFLEGGREEDSGRQPCGHKSASGTGS